MPQDAKLVQDHSESNIVFIPSQLDDADLTTAQFRVYCHLGRRSQRTSWPGIPSMAKVCRLSENTVRESLNELVALGMVVVTDRPGKSCLYTLTKPSSWRYPSQTIPLPNNHTGPSPNNGTPPLPKNGGRRVSSKGIQERNPIGVDIFGDADGNPAPSFQTKMQGKASLDEVRAYVKEQGLPETDADFFFHKMESTGWKTKTGPVKVWRSHFQTYKIGNWLPSQNQKHNGKTNGNIRTATACAANAGTSNANRARDY